MDDPRLPRHWFIFGENKETGLVDISDSEGDVLILVPRAFAEEVIAARDRYIDWVQKRLDDADDAKKATPEHRPDTWEARPDEALVLAFEGGPWNAMKYPGCPAPAPGYIDAASWRGMGPDGMLHLVHGTHVDAHYIWRNGRYELWTPTARITGL